MKIDKTSATLMGFLKTLSVIAIAALCLAQGVYASTAAEIATIISAKGLTTAVSSNTVTVTGTLQNVSSAGDYLTFNIGADTVVIWRAQLTGGTSGNYALININGGSGRFVVESGTIGNTGTGRSITNKGTVKITGGEISAKRDGYAIYSESSANLMLGGNPSITGKIFTYPEKLSVLVVSDAFAPAAKIYTLDFPTTQYAVSNVAVTNGRDFLRNFVLANANYALSAAGVHLAMANAYKVGFNLNGGTGVAPDTIGVLQGGKLYATPSTSGFAKTGYVNDGKWYANSLGTTEFVFGESGTPVTANTTLYLKWFNPAISITTVQLPDAVRSTTYYNQTLASSSEIPAIWSIESGTLPTGLNLNGATGVVSGTPSVYGTFDFTIKADNGYQSTTKDFSIKIGNLKIVLGEGFESSTDGWTFANGTETNKWMIGSNTRVNGSYSAYISSNASTNSYNANYSSIVHLYRDINSSKKISC
ncbi:hypothetical protein R83H12_02115 [Fibrobacteria bacterium R8-3-H12]